MAGDVAGGWQSAVYPASFGNPGAIIQQGIQNQERQSERYLQLAEQKQRQDEQKQFQNLRLINQATDFDQYKTGEQHIDDFALGQIKKISDNALTNYIKLPPAELQYRLNNDLKPLFQWHTAAQNTYKNLNNTLTDFNKTYPNADLGKARQIANSQFANDFMQLDENGALQMKHPEQIRPADYSQLLQQPEVLGQVINDTSPFDKAIYAIPKEAVGGESYVNNKGSVVAHKWSGMKPTGDMGEYTYAPDGKPLSIKLSGTDIPAVKDANGNPMRIMSDEMYKTLQGNPAVAGSMEAMWQREKPRIEAQYQQTTGQPLDAHTDDILKRAYLYQQANRLIGHDLKIEEIQKTPKPPTVNISLGNTAIHDVYGEVDRTFNKTNRPHQSLPFNELPFDTQAALLEKVNKLLPHDIGENQLGQGDVQITKRDGEYWIQNHNNGQFIAPLSELDLNLSANKGVKATQKVLQQNSQQSTGKKKISGF